MTSLAFILGVVPLVLSTGAGAEMRQSLGTAVFAGMLGVTLFGLLFTPVFYVLVRGAAEMRTVLAGMWSRLVPMARPADADALTPAAAAPPSGTPQPTAGPQPSP